MICSVCFKENCSYRCPQCKKPYCSVDCYKIHKKTCTGNENQNNQNPVDDEEKKDLPIPPFELFRSHPDIIRALGDPRLQKIIERIDSAKDREKELVKQIEIDPDFKFFVEQLLNAAPPTILP